MTCMSGHGRFCHRKLRDFQAAAADYGRLIDLGHRAVRIFNARAYCYASLGRYAAAVQAGSCSFRLFCRFLALAMGGGWPDMAGTGLLSCAGAGGGGVFMHGPKSAREPVSSHDMRVFELQVFANCIEVRCGNSPTQHCCRIMMRLCGGTPPTPMHTTTGGCSMAIVLAHEAELCSAACCSLSS
jgi:hypothetical protein